MTQEGTIPLPNGLPSYILQHEKKMTENNALGLHHSWAVIQVVITCI